MSLINFVLSSHCTQDKGISLGDMIELRVFVGLLGDQIAPKASEKPN